jgi:hypothetical protein
MEVAMQVSHQSLRRYSTLSLLAAALFAGSALATGPSHESSREGVMQQASPNTPVLTNENSQRPRIQLAILLDTSSSMDGLIDQTRNQLWQIVNEFSAARKDGVVPILEIALYEYGNDGLSVSNGYIRRLNGFTRELDAVSEGLFSLTTNGGSEYCGYVIKTAINDLQWSPSNTDVKAIFIAGNESFAQGPVDYHEVAKLAQSKGILINTIHAGGWNEGINEEWQAGALLAAGKYMNIDADQQVVHVDAPQDQKIAELNAKLNSTYIPYGAKGAEKIRRQMEQDEASSKVSAGLLAKRAKSKSSSFYNNATWDLVDAFEEGKIDEKALTEIDEKELPKPMKGLSGKEKVEYVREKTQERKLLKEQITELGKSRSAYVAKVKSEQAAAAPSMGDALTQAVKQQAEQKNFVFEKQE